MIVWINPMMLVGQKSADHHQDIRVHHRWSMLFYWIIKRFLFVLVVLFKRSKGVTRVVKSQQSFHPWSTMDISAKCLFNHPIVVETFHTKESEPLDGAREEASGSYVSIDFILGGPWTLSQIPRQIEEKHRHKHISKLRNDWRADNVIHCAATRTRQKRHRDRLSGVTVVCLLMSAEWAAVCVSVAMSAGDADMYVSVSSLWYGACTCVTGAKELAAAVHHVVIC